MPDPVDPVIAKVVVDKRWPGSLMARNTIRDEDYVYEHLKLAAAGITHDERVVELYHAEVEALDA